MSPRKDPLEPVNGEWNRKGDIDSDLSDVDLVLELPRTSTGVGSPIPIRVGVDDLDSLGIEKKGDHMTLWPHHMTSLPRSHDHITVLGVSSVQQVS